MPTHRPPHRTKTVIAKKRSMLTLGFATLTGTAVFVAAYVSGSGDSLTAVSYPRSHATSSAHAGSRDQADADRYKGRRWVTSTSTRGRWNKPTTTSSTTSSSTTSSTTSSATTSSTTSSTTTTSSPTTTSTSTSGWPGASNTGVPAGTTLTRYTGPCTITSTATLNAVDASSCSAILIHAPNVVIKNSLLPRIDATDGYGNNYAVNVSGSTVKAGSWSDGAIWGYNITATRVNVTGGQHSFHCNDNCTVTDSWLHDQYNPGGGSYHNNAFITNGGTNMVVRHNTLHCTAILNSTDGGCTADVSLFGDFDPVTNVTIDNNLLKANSSSISYCAYGGYQPTKNYPVATNIKYTNNVFERGSNGKCGVYGPVTSFQSSASGNVWSGNKFDDGVAVQP